MHMPRKGMKLQTRLNLCRDTNTIRHAYKVKEEKVEKNLTAHVLLIRTLEFFPFLFLRDLEEIDFEELLCYNFIFGSPFVSHTTVC